MFLSIHIRQLSLSRYSMFSMKRSLVNVRSWRDHSLGSRTDPFRKRSLSVSVGLPRTLYAYFQCKNVKTSPMRVTRTWVRFGTERKNRSRNSTQAFPLESSSNYKPVTILRYIFIFKYSLDNELQQHFQNNNTKVQIRPKLLFELKINPSRIESYFS